MATASWFRHGVRCLDPFHDQAILDLYTDEMRTTKEPEARDET